MDADVASRALGIELVSCSEGRATTSMTVRDDMVNGHAIAHGGLVFTLADTAFACACNSHGPVTVAAGAEITFVAPARRRGRAGRRGAGAGELRPVRRSTTSRCAAATRSSPSSVAAATAWPPYRGRDRHRRIRSAASPRPSRLRPRVAAAGGGRRVQRARLRRHEHGGPVQAPRHREVGDLPPRARQGGAAAPRARPRAGRPVRRRGAGAGARTAARSTGSSCWCAAACAVLQDELPLRHAAAAGPRQHRGRAGGARAPPRLRPLRRAVGARGRAGRRRASRPRPHGHRPPAVRARELHRRVVPAPARTAPRWTTPSWASPSTACGPEPSAIYAVAPLRMSTDSPAACFS